LGCSSPLESGTCLIPLKAGSPKTNGRADSFLGARWLVLGSLYRCRISLSALRGFAIAIGSSSPARGSMTRDFGRWTLDLGPWTSDVGRWTLEVRCGSLLAAGEEQAGRHEGGGQQRDRDVHGEGGQELRVRGAFLVQESAP